MHSYGAMDYLNAYSYLFTWLQKACQGSMISADDEHLDILLVSNNVHCIINLALHNFKWTIEVYSNIKVYIKPCFLWQYLYKPLAALFHIIIFKSYYDKHPNDLLRGKNQRNRSAIIRAWTFYWIAFIAIIYLQHPYMIYSKMQCFSN